MPFPETENNNPRRSRQSSYKSRENSIERGFPSMRSREKSSDRLNSKRNCYNGKREREYQSSRENSSERYVNWPKKDFIVNMGKDEETSWRRNDGIHTSTNGDRKIAELTEEFKNSIELHEEGVLNNVQRMLFDPSNPTKPIVVANRLRDSLTDNENYNELHPQYVTNTKPKWFEKTSDEYKIIKSKHLVEELEKLDDELEILVNKGELIRRWDRCQRVRERIQWIFGELLSSDMKFCQLAHVEHYFWKLLFYKIIEVLRKQTLESDDVCKTIFKERSLEIVEEGTKYLESLLKHLEARFGFKMESYIGENAASFKRGQGYITLALVSAQKIFLFLGDLARYREQINQTNNFGRAKNFYIKAQQIVPNNGRPFNQLALCAVYGVSLKMILLLLYHQLSISET